LARQVQLVLAIAMGKRPRGCPRTRWSDYISDLAWSRLVVWRQQNYLRLLLTVGISSPRAAGPATLRRIKAGMKVNELKQKCSEKSAKQTLLPQTFAGCNASGFCRTRKSYVRISQLHFRLWVERVPRSRKHTSKKTPLSGSNRSLHLQSRNLWGAVRKNIIFDRFSTKIAISAQR